MRYELAVRINDVGGLQGFGSVNLSDADQLGEPFHADWEARVFALNIAMVGSGVYTLDEFRDAIERMPPGEYLRASYYERWLHGITTLLVEKGLVRPEVLAGV
jgi:nitrile hydratase